MNFTKKCMYLGMTENELKDGGRYYGISLFEPESGPVTVNVMQGHKMLDTFAGMKFGEPINVNFVLRPKDKLYRLSIA